MKLRTLLLLPLLFLGATLVAQVASDEDEVGAAITLSPFQLDQVHERLSAAFQIGHDSRGSVIADGSIRLPQPVGVITEDFVADLRVLELKRVEQRLVQTHPAEAMHWLSSSVAIRMIDAPAVSLEAGRRLYGNPWANDADPIPEPSALSLVGLGGAVLLVFRRRR